MTQKTIVNHPTCDPITAASKQHDMETMLMSVMSEGVMLKDIHGISNEMMEQMYSHAHHFYQQGRLDDAESFFSFLCMYDLNNADYFIGLGAVNQLKKNYQKACDLYALAYVIAKDNFSPIFYSGQCQLLMGNFVKAMQCFDLICRRANDESLKKKSRIYLQTIKKNRTDSAVESCSEKQET
ncbi:Salmonella invasin chaperone [Serratia fonticola]|nr:type III secretion system translocator chaperone SicA [Serratia fonticola]CAI1686038.1 Salmonella invasin chaperone [Serratia fonticola]